MKLAAALLLAALGATLPAAAQGPEAEWRTVETPHFRVHYPAASEAWSRRLATRLESVRAAVGDEVGYTPPQRIDVVVADPVAAANGSAWPLLPGPRLVLWTTPPAAGSSLGHLSDWGELLAVHEMAHLAHLLRPSRAPWRALLERTLWPLAPLATGAPRWATEGYATLVEGRLTGSGRPNSALRAAILRVWGRAGRLPSYGALADDRDSFLGSSMAYLVGSAFLDWAERRSGDPRALVKLWAAATARADRDFDAAWERVFGETPRAGYARFVAETSAAALASEARQAPAARTGELWLERRWATGEPEVSPDGGELAAILRERDAPTRLAVWPLAPKPDEGASKKTAAGDPEDPAAAPLPPRARRPARELVEPAGRELLSARFLAGGGAMLLTMLSPDRRGVEHADLWLWSGSGAPRRLTRNADLRDADPSPDGRRAVAVRWRAGASQLVAVDLENGAETPLGEPRIDLVLDSPRFAPDGGVLAWLEHRDGRWRAMVAPLSSPGVLGAARELAPPRGGEPTHLAWRRDGSLLYAAVARGETIEIEALAVAGGAVDHRVTRGAGASFAPAPSPDGRTLFYLALSPDGVDLRRLDLDAATTQAAPELADAEPAESLPAFAAAAVTAPRPYGLGRAELQALVGGFAGSEEGIFELGARAGDLLGRWEVLALAGFGSESARRGGALRGTLRLAPTELELSAARVRLGERDVSALELAAAHDATFAGGNLRLRGALGWNEGGDETLDRSIAQLGLAGELARRRGRLTFTARAGAERSAALDGDGRLDRLRLGLRLEGEAAALAIGAATWRASRDAGSGLRPSLGGVPSSLAPSTLEPGRIDLPALAAGALVAPRIDQLELRATTKALPLALIAGGYRAHPGAGPVTELRLIGLERTWRLAPLPLVGLPAVEARVGVVRLTGDGGERGTRWWIGLGFPVPR